MLRAEGDGVYVLVPVRERPFQTTYSKIAYPHFPLNDIFGYPISPQTSIKYFPNPRYLTPDQNLILLQALRARHQELRKRGAVYKKPGMSATSDDIELRRVLDRIRQQEAKLGISQ